MKTFEIEWAMIPTNFSPHRIARVEAETSDDAKKLLNDSLRGRGLADFSLIGCWEYTPPQVKGQVISVG